MNLLLLIYIWPIFRLLSPGRQRRCERVVVPRERVEELVSGGVMNTPFCPSQEKFHTVVLRGLRNISEAP